jgi:hypothetical protein
MQARQGLLQTFPLILQTLGNPAFLQELAKTGDTPDWSELMRVLTEMTGYKNRADLIRKLSPDEMQARQQQQNSPDMIRMEMQKQRLMGQQVIQREKLAIAAEAEGRKTQMDAGREEALLQLKAQLDLAVERERANAQLLAELERAKIEAGREAEKLAFEREKLRVETELEREKIEAQGASADNKVLVELTKALMATAAKSEDGETAAVERNPEGLIRKVIQSAISGVETIKDIERDPEGNIVRIRSRSA